MSGTSDPKARHRLAPRRSLRKQLIMPIVAPAIALTGLWGYTGVGLASEQIQLQDDAERTGTTGGSALSVVSALQQERRLTALWQASRSDAARTALDQARTRTDASVVDFRAGLAAVDGSLGAPARSLGASLDTLAGQREAIDARTLSPENAFRQLTDVIRSGTDLIGFAVRSEDGPLSQGGNATATLVRMVEMLSREDALLTAALPGSSMSAAARQQFGHYRDAQREIQAALAVGDLPESARARYTRLAASEASSTVVSIEDAVATGSATRLPDSANAWRTEADALVTDLQGLAAGSLDELADTASGRATGLLIGLLAGTTLTVGLLTAGAVLGLRARRSTLDAVTELQRRTEEMARNWPQTLAQSERGEPLAPLADEPDGPVPGELQHLGAAIDRLQHAAVDTVLSQSRGHAGAEKVLGQLTRRTQTLIHRLIALLDDLERKHGDSDLLKDIFKVDHLATRVRRHAENLVILGDTPPSRRMTEPVTITDVMRSAVAETEHYTRVKVENLPATKRVALAGRAVADVTHLLAELVENATNFSPPYTQVVVSALHVAEGVALHVEDHGLGIPAAQLAQANHILAHPQKPDMAALGADPRLGHFVVARLAQRHRIRVELRASVYGGTLAIVFLPAHMLEELDSPVMDQLRAAAQVSGNVVTTGSVPPPQVTSSLGSVPAVVAAPVPRPQPVAAASDTAGVTASGETHSRVADSGDLDDSAAGHVWEPSGGGFPDYTGFPTYGGAGLVSPHPTDQPEPEPAPTPHRPHDATPPQPAYGPPQPAYVPPQTAYAPPQPAHAPRQPAADRPAPPEAVPPAPPATPRPYAPQGDGGTDLQQPSALPRRTRGSSLAVQLRREAADAGSRMDNDGGRPANPEASARIFAAIRRGMDQATGTHHFPGAGDRPAD
ncbi:nitrate- and nitrite sensing domain-containing protein [Streptomyces sp. NPDC087908]|uniref:sensor histidine kinase n=1 Tax=Streptomyces sp. NPDC087908 TaxID=3365820 RepID=UPI003818B2E0